MPNKQGGLIGTLILIVIALAFLKYFFDWSVFEAISTPRGQETVKYTHRVVEVLWSYLSVPFTLIWEKIFRPFLGLLFDLTLQSFKHFLDGATQANLPE